MMNPLLSPARSIFSPLSQLMPHCNRLLKSINDDTSHEGKTLIEQALWNEVKKIKSLSEPTSIFLYLIGYYHAVLYSIANVSSTNDLLQYHLLIRLGDLNRYIDRIDLAKYYYSNARNLFPQYGQAYNQLGLLAKPSECYKCCYYYTRASRSSEKPLDIAESNLRIAIGKFECQILDHILNQEPSLDDDDVKFDKLPETAIDWFYVIVVAIHADNIKPIVKLFLKYLSENFSIQSSTKDHNNTTITRLKCDRNSYTLLASLDILLDWLKLGSQDKTIVPQIGAELRQIRSSLINKVMPTNNDKSSSSEGKVPNTISQSNINSSNNNQKPATRLPSKFAELNHKRASNQQSQNVINASSSSASNHSISSSRESLALAHDHILRGFSPLASVHRDLIFEVQPKSPQNVLEQQPIELTDGDMDYQFAHATDLIQVVERIKLKIDTFVPPVVRRKTRNIALESILSNMDSCL